MRRADSPPEKSPTPKVERGDGGEQDGHRTRLRSAFGPASGRPAGSRVSAGRGRFARVTDTPTTAAPAAPRAPRAAGRHPAAAPRGARPGRRPRSVLHRPGGARGGPGGRRWPAWRDLTRRRPMVVAMPTGADAERLAARPAAVPARGRPSSYFPAWETLPFERVSPSIETMGRRLRTLWRLRTGDPTLPVVVAPARALVQRLGPHVEDVEPIVVRRRATGSTSHRAGASAWCWPATAASTRWSTAARSRCAARSSTCSRPRRTPRCASTCGATRSTGWPSSPWPTSAPPSTSSAVQLFRGPGAAAHPGGPRAGRAPAGHGPVGPRAVAAPGRRRGVRGHGGLARLAGRPASTSCSTWCPTTPRSCWWTPGGCGTGPWTSLAEEADLGAHAVAHLGPSPTDRRDLPRLHVDFDRLLRPHRRAVVVGGQRGRLARLSPAVAALALAAGGGRGRGAAAPSCARSSPTATGWSCAPTAPAPRPASTSC